MQLGMIGLGRMGANMVRRLLKGGHQCVVFDRSPKVVEELVKEKAVGSSALADFVKKLDQAAGDLADGSRGRRRPNDRRPPATPGSRRHPHRRRQFLLCRRYPARQRTRAEAAQLCGRRHQRRRLGPGARLLHDDRRADQAVRRLDPIFKTLAPGVGDITRTPGREQVERHGRAGLLALRAERRRPLRQDGAQRHRIRHDGGLRRGLGRPARGKHRQACARDRRRDHSPPRSGALSIRSQSPRHYRSLASRQRDRLLAARPDGRRCWTKSTRSQASRGGYPTRARDAGRSRRRSTRQCPRPCSPRPSTSGSARAAKRTFRTNCCRPCVSSSAAIWKSPPASDGEKGRLP